MKIGLSLKTNNKLMKRILFWALFASIGLSSCQDDVDRTIQTNLPVESRQLLDNSLNISESLFFAILRYGDYQSPNTIIPGCPTVTFTESTRTVTLNFDTKIACEIKNQVERKGKIILQYGLNSPTSSWTLTYQDYQFGEFKLQGVRTFTPKSLIEIQESFEDLRIISKNEAGTTINGNLTHQISRTLFGINTINSTGEVTGINPVGRSIQLIVDSPRKLEATCIRSGKVYPRAGQESWRISREPGKSVLHSLEYVAKDSCKVDAFAQLSDGRKLLLNP